VYADVQVCRNYAPACLFVTAELKYSYKKPQFFLGKTIAG